jgi:hypothetical protein
MSKFGGFICCLLFDGVERHFQQYFSCIVVVSFIGGENWSKSNYHTITTTTAPLILMG